MFKRLISIFFVLVLTLTFGLGTKVFAASYPITEELIHNNRPGTALSPQGFVIHSTDDPGATAQRIHDYWDSQYASASAHYLTDNTQIIHLIPENEVAWHVGYVPNRKFLGVEMAEPAVHDPAYFNETYNRTVWLVADALKRYGWNIDQVYSHHMISNMYGGDHMDPDAYLAEYGKTFDQMRADIQTALNQLNAPPAPPAVAPPAPQPAPQPVAQKSVPKAQPVVKPKKIKSAEVVQNNGYIVIFGRWVWQSIEKAREA